MSTSMTLDLPAIFARAKEAREKAKALPGPRAACSRRHDGTAQVYATSLGPARMVVPIAEPTATYGPAIAHACTALPLLAADVEALVAEVERLRARCRKARSCIEGPAYRDAVKAWLTEED